MRDIMVELNLYTPIYMICKNLNKINLLSTNRIDYKYIINLKMFI